MLFVLLQKREKTASYSWEMSYLDRKTRYPDIFHTSRLL
jgi:hypothetical protein